MQSFNVTLPAVPADWKPSEEEGQTFSYGQRLANFGTCSLEAVGPRYANLVKRTQLGRTLVEELELEAALREADQAGASDLPDEPESAELLRSDPRNWKKQDHYAVLGLSALRWNATEEDIKNAYRRKVLKHHPDKRAQAQDGPVNDDFFKCIQKAWEVMSNTTTRRQWDSCDPKFVESVPPAKPKGDWYKVYGPIFEREAHFSTKQPVPLLGGPDATREQVESFYNFWLSFSSWRSFEMRDKDDGHAADNRDEKRWMDKQNRANRTKLKREDVARRNKIVEQAMKLDERVVKYRKEAREEEAAAKRAAKAARRGGNANGSASGASTPPSASSSAPAKPSPAAKPAGGSPSPNDVKAAIQKAMAAKKKAAAAAKALDGVRESIRTVLRTHTYFVADPQKVNTKMLQAQLVRVERTLKALDEEQTKALDAALKATKGSGEAAALVWEEYTVIADAALQASSDAAQAKDAAAKDAAAAAAEAAKEAPWTSKELAALIKGVKMVPPGSLERWQKIATHVWEHGHEAGEDVPQRTALQCVQKSKAIDQGAVDAVERSRIQDQERKEKPAVDIGDVASTREVTGDEPNAWTSAEQKALEAALVKYPAADFKQKPADRWERVASEIASRSVAEVKARVKALAK